MQKYQYTQNIKITLVALLLFSITVFAPVEQQIKQQKMHLIDEQLLAAVMIDNLEDVQTCLKTGANPHAQVTINGKWTGDKLTIAQVAHNNALSSMRSFLEFQDVLAEHNLLDTVDTHESFEKVGTAITIATLLHNTLS